MTQNEVGGGVNSYQDVRIGELQDSGSSVLPGLLMFAEESIEIEMEVTRMAVLNYIRFKTFPFETIFSSL
jgi:hypothetical protein